MAEIDAVIRAVYHRQKGGPTSGNWGHSGRPGKRGGSAPQSGVGAAMSLRTGRDAKARQEAKRGTQSISIGGAGDAKIAPGADINALIGKLKKLKKGVLAAPDQLYRDPDVTRILNEGQSYDAKSSTFIHMLDGKCHWNASKLYKTGEVDAIVIGYTNNGNGWYQHTWGLKDGKVVETTASNAGNKMYYGLELKGKEASAFADWTEAHPPGGGVVRRVP